MKDKIIKTVNYGIKLKNLYDDYHISAYSSQAAFFVMLSAIPLLMLAIIIASTFFPYTPSEVNEFFKDFFTEDVSIFVSEILNEILAQSTAPLASFTTVILLWTSLKGVRSIGDGVGTIYNSEKEYNIVQLTIRSALFTVIMIFVWIMSLAFFVFAYPLEIFVENFLGGRGEFILTLLNLKNIIFFITLTLMFSAAYKLLARSSISFKNQLYGAGIAAGGWILFSYGFSIYLTYFSSYSRIYGSLGAVIIFMLWLYMCMNILLCGALFNKIRINHYKI